jgi:pimeloyl-ACP methyl ester carboxylesterase
MSKLKPIIFLLCIGSIGFIVGFWLPHRLPPFLNGSNSDLLSPFVPQPSQKSLPLLRYTIPALTTQTYTAAGPLLLTKTLTPAAISSASSKSTNNFTSYLFQFTTTGKKMTGLLNLPTTPAPAGGYPVLIMIRGYVPPDIYQPGVGTKNAAEFFAAHGFATLAPDFLGYGGSDPDVTDNWESRFIKPTQVIELIKTIQTYPSLTTPDAAVTVQLNPSKLGIWAHSNGGQIGLTALEILQQPIPATFWAPVTAPFPYSLLYFSDEETDEGKLTRKGIAEFEKDYDAFDFSLSQHLNQLHGEFNLHHGTADDAALKAWSDEFLVKVKKVNAERLTASKQATESATKNDPITFNYYVYPGANHNLQPGWDTAIQRDLEFFDKQFKLK